MTSRPKIVLLGMLTKMPVGGVAWLVAQYAAGFERLGFDVYYVEAHARTPSMFVLDEQDDGSERAAAYLGELMPRFGLADRWAFHALHADGRCLGMTATQLQRLYRDAALIVNLHGGTVPLAEHAATGRLCLLSTDPVELELELARGDAQAIEFMDAHTSYFTWGLNYGNPDCRLPWSVRYPFVPSAPPVVVDFWATGEAPAPDAPFTTIGNWRQHWREVHFEGARYGWSKHTQFLKILDLPSLVPARFELALSSFEEEDRRLLEAHGWGVRSGLEISSDIESYRRFIVQSGGELTAAKEQNVSLRSGWFSERSATYLAAGRPVITQDTGFGNALPAGEGLLAFADLDGAAAAVEAVVADPKRHRRAALEIARDHLNYDVVLTSLLDHVGIAVRHRASPRRGPSLLPMPAPAELPPGLRLTPVSRRPLVLDPATERAVLGRPVPLASLHAPAGDGAPEASVIVVVLDNLAVTRMALESVVANTPAPAHELIVVDNGSGADTRRYLSVLAARHPNVRLIRNDANRGFAGGTNQGLAVARGRTIVLLNNDTIVPPGWLAALVRHLDDPTVGLVGPVTNRCGNEAEVPCDYEDYAGLIAMAGRQAAGAGPPFDLPVAMLFCAALRRDVLSAVGLLDERFEIGMFEDDDYARRARDAGYRVVCAPDVFVHHFGEASLGQLAAEGRYGPLFDANRRRFEAKWGEPWQGHERRPDAGYEAMVGRVRAAVEAFVPPGSIALVVSKGDDALLRLPGAQGRHFPGDGGGGYAGHHPADDAAAIDALESALRQGATHLVVPATSAWWLDHYRGFARHLDERYVRAHAAADTGVIFHLKDVKQ